MAISVVYDPQIVQCSALRYIGAIEYLCICIGDLCHTCATNVVHCVRTSNCELLVVIRRRISYDSKCGGVIY